MGFLGHSHLFIVNILRDKGLHVNMQESSVPAQSRWLPRELVVMMPFPSTIQVAALNKRGPAGQGCS